eukprot:6107788-Amphidinium_carterae.1
MAASLLSTSRVEMNDSHSAWLKQGFETLALWAEIQLLNAMQQLVKFCQRFQYCFLFLASSAQRTSLCSGGGWMKLERQNECALLPNYSTSSLTHSRIGTVQLARPPLLNERPKPPSGWHSAQVQGSSFGLCLNNGVGELPQSGVPKSPRRYGSSVQNRAVSQEHFT